MTHQSVPAPTTTPTTTEVIADAELAGLLAAAAAAEADLEWYAGQVRAAETARHITLHAVLDVEAALRSLLDVGYTTVHAAQYALVEDAANALVAVNPVCDAARVDCAGCRAIAL